MPDRTLADPDLTAFLTATTLAEAQTALDLSGWIASLDSPASVSTLGISGIVTNTNGIYRPAVDTGSSFRFQNIAGDVNALAIDTLNPGIKTPGITLGGATNNPTSGGIFANRNSGDPFFAFQRDGASLAQIRGNGSGTNAGIAVTNGAGSFDWARFEEDLTTFSFPLQLNDGQIRPDANAADAFRFQNVGGAADALTIDTLNPGIKTPGAAFGGATDTLTEGGLFLNRATDNPFLELQRAGDAIARIQGNGIGVDAGFAITNGAGTADWVSFDGDGATFSTPIRVNEGRFIPDIDDSDSFRFTTADGVTNIVKIDTASGILEISAASGPRKFLFNPALGEFNTEATFAHFQRYTGENVRVGANSDARFSVGQGVGSGGPGDVGLVNAANDSLNVPCFFGRVGSTQTAEAIRVQDHGGTRIFGIGPAGEIRTNQSVANTNTPSGATARALEVFDASGTSLGFIPVYAAQW